MKTGCLVLTSTADAVYVVPLLLPEPEAKRDELPEEVSLSTPCESLVSNDILNDRIRQHVSTLAASKLHL